MSLFELVPDRWYGWQMLPGYGGERNVPYFSPIRVIAAAPRKTGKSVLGLYFRNALYAEGVQDVQYELRILKREANYLIADVLAEGSRSSERAAVISHIEFEWLRRFCPQLPPVEMCAPAAQHSVSFYLDELFPHYGVRGPGPGS